MIRFIRDNWLIVLGLAILWFGFDYWRTRRKPPQLLRARKDPDYTWPAALLPREEFVRQLMEREAVQCTLVIPDPGTQPESPVATRFAEVVCGNKGEKWPLCKDRPMVGICQFNLTEMPYVPDHLNDLAFVSFFLAPGEDCQDIDIPYSPDREREKWVVRAYRSLDDLAPYTDAPKTPETLRPCGARFEIMTDYLRLWNRLCMIRDSHNLPDDWVRDVLKGIFDFLDAQGDRCWGTKIGGWVPCIWRVSRWPLAFQIGSEKEVGLNWGKGGCLFLWRDKSPDAKQEWICGVEDSKEH